MTPTNVVTTDAGGERRAGIILIVATLISVVAMLHHPSASSHDPAAAMAEIGEKSALGRVVHAVLIALMGLELYAFGVFAERLGVRRVGARLGLIAYAIGVGAMIGAATISGFVVTRLAELYTGSSDATTFAHSTQLAMAGNQALAQLGTMAFSIAIFAWSVALLRDRSMRWLAAIGCAASVLPALALAFGFIRLNVGGMTLVVVAEAVWNIAVGITLIRDHRSID